MITEPRLLPSNLNCNEDIPPVAVAVAVTVDVPETLPGAGAVMLTAGGVIVFWVVTAIPAEVVLWPTESTATAVRV